MYFQGKLISVEKYFKGCAPLAGKFTIHGCISRFVVYAAKE
jgi:hypothetical protein